MIERLIQCPGCSRHVKSCDATCPFCGASARCAPAPAQRPYRRVAAAAAVAASVAACSTAVSHTPFYGGPDITANTPSMDEDADDDGSADAPMDVAPAADSK
jgi:hypothetical protein